MYVILTTNTHMTVKYVNIFINHLEFSLPEKMTGSKMYTLYWQFAKLSITSY